MEVYKVDSKITQMVNFEDAMNEFIKFANKPLSIDDIDELAVHLTNVLSITKEDINNSTRDFKDVINAIVDISARIDHALSRCSKFIKDKVVQRDSLENLSKDELIALIVDIRAGKKK